MSILISGTTGIDAGGLPINNSGNAEVEGTLIVGGNVGIGVTPSAWSSVYDSIELGTLVVTSAASRYNAITTNAYDNGSWKYKVSSVPVTSFALDSGDASFRWSIAPAGTAGNQITWTTAMALDASGNLLLTSGTGALGYGTGAGGTVTQLTSKSTAVTLNKPSGRIYTSNTALAAGASATFVVYNSLVVANDVVVPNGVYATTDPTNYKIEVSRILDGYFLLKVTNISGGSLSEAVVINFVLIKGAIA